MNNTFEEEIRSLLESGNKIAAIKRYREVTRVGLAEALAAVESFGRGTPLPAPIQPAESDVTDQIVDLLTRGKKIAAVKLYREKLGVGLKDAKDAVERIGAQNDVPTSSGSGCLGIVLLGISVVVEMFI